MSRTYNNNSKSNSKDVNTTGRQYYNSEGKHKSTLELGFWNKMISLKFYPMLPKDKITETERFDYNNGMFTSMSTERAVHMAELIEKEIIPAIEAGEKVTGKGYPIGSDSAMVVGTDSQDDQTYGYIALLRKIDRDTMVPAEGMVYQFNTVLTIESYDYENGDFSAGKSGTMEIREFAKQLRAAAESLIGASAHAARFIDKWYRDRIAEAVGATSGSNNGSSNTPYNNSSVFNDKYSSGNKPANTEHSKITNVDDINALVDMN